MAILNLFIFFCDGLWVSGFLDFGACVRARRGAFGCGLSRILHLVFSSRILGLEFS